MRSRVALRNTTGYPDDEVKRLIGFAWSELELPGGGSVVVRVRHTRLSRHRKTAGARYTYGTTGHAYGYVFVAPDVPKGAWWETHLRVGKPDEFPVRWYDRRGASASIGDLADWREALVAIAAHEGKHIEHYQRWPGRDQVRRRMSGVVEEDRCDAYAAKMIARYRGSVSRPATLPRSRGLNPRP